MILLVGVTVDGDVGVSERSEHLLDDGEGLFEVSLAVGTGSVGTGETGSDETGVRAMVGPAGRPSAGS